MKLLHYLLPKIQASFIPLGFLSYRNISTATVEQNVNDNTGYNISGLNNTAYKAGQSVADMANGKDGTIAKVSITYGQSKTERQTHAKSSEAIASKVNAGGNVAIVATGAGEQSNINIIGSDVYGGTGTTLIADNQINLLAAQSTSEEHTRNKSSGWSAGAVISVGTQGLTGGITAGGNVGKGKGDGESVTQRNTNVGSGGTTRLTSGGTTTLAGAQVTGNRVEVDAKELNIISLQDTSNYKSKQQDASAQITIGNGVSGSASYSQSKINANYASVGEQSGIIAGDGGYSVNVQNNTNLVGGIITSSQAAEEAGRNRFSTGTLTASNVENHSDYKGSGFGLTGGVSVGADGSAQPDKNGNPTGVLGSNRTLGVTKSIGYG